MGGGQDSTPQGLGDGHWVLSGWGMAPGTPVWPQYSSRGHNLVPRALQSSLHPSTAPRDLSMAPWDLFSPCPVPP